MHKVSFLRKLTAYLPLFLAFYGAGGVEVASAQSTNAAASPPAPSVSAEVQPVSAAQTAPNEPDSDLRTRNGFRLGVGVSAYRYQEHVNAQRTLMHDVGPEAAVIGNATKAYGNSVFISAEGRLAYSELHYLSRAGLSAHGLKDYTGDLRLLIGRDWALPQIGAEFSPYSGFGARELIDDSRGAFKAPSTGDLRTIQYLYLPFGASLRWRGPRGGRISTRLEYDQLLRGMATTREEYSDQPYQTIHDAQHHGFGLRGDILYQKGRWSVGPFVEYWNINRSVIDYGYIEPHNQTIDFGLQILRSF